MRSSSSSSSSVSGSEELEKKLGLSECSAYIPTASTFIDVHMYIKAKSKSRVLI